MFSSADLYEIFKPQSDESLITDYSVVIGGTNLPADLERGAIILTPLSSKKATAHFKDFKNLIEPSDEGEPYKIAEYSYIQTLYQCDIYKINDINALEIQAEVEAYKVREWLSSMECLEYLRAKKAGILPIYSQLRFTQELLSNKKFVNRVSFDFEIISLNEIKEWVNVVDKIKIEKTIILQGEHNG